MRRLFSKRSFAVVIVLLALVVVAGVWMLVLDSTGALDVGGATHATQRETGDEHESAADANDNADLAANDSETDEPDGAPAEADSTAATDAHPGDAADHNGDAAPDINGGAAHLNAGIRGRVLDGEDEPVPGALLMLTVRGRTYPVLDGPALQTARTDANGVFEFHGLLPGDDHFFTLSLEHEENAGLLVVSRSVSKLTAGEMRDVGVLRLLREATLSGVVLDEQEEPVGEANVLVTWNVPAHARTRSVRVAEDGTFRVDQLHAGTFNIYAQAEGYRHSELRRVELAEGEEVGPLVLMLREPLSLVVTVQDTGGEPLYGASVSLEEQQQSGRRRVDAATTNRFGQARFDGVPYTRVRVGAEAEGYLAVNVPVVLDPQAQPHELTLTLHRGATLEGLLVDSLGEPLAGVELHLRSLDDYGATQMIRVRAESDGRFVLPGLDPVPMTLEARQVRFGPFSLRPGETTRTGTLVVPATGSLEMHISLAGEVPQPLAGARVVARPLDTSAASGGATLVGEASTEASSDDDGVARLRLSEGTYAVRVIRRGLAMHYVAEALHVVAGETARLEVVMSPGGRVTGTVRTRNDDDRGEPVQTPLQLIHENGHAVYYGASDTEGTFVFAQVVPGRYRLYAGAAGEPSRFGTQPREYFTVREGDVTRRDLRLAVESATLRLSVRFTGFGQSGATLGIARRTGLDGSGTSVRYDVAMEAALDRRSQVTFEGLPVGVTLVALLRTDDQPAPLEFLLGELRAGAHSRVLYVAAEGEYAGIIWGNVWHSDGESGVAGARIQARRVDTDGRPLALYETTSELDDGSFRLDGVLPGRYLVAVTAPGKASVVQEHTVMRHREAPPLSVTLGEAGHLVFRVQLANPASEGYVRATLYHEGHDDAVQIRTLRPGELLHFSHLQVGETYQVHLESAHHRSHRAHYIVRRDDTELIRIKLESQ